MLLHRHPRKVGHLLTQAGETIEERGLAGVRRANQRHRSRSGGNARKLQNGRAAGAATAAMAIAALAHEVLGGFPLEDVEDFDVRSNMRLAVSLRSATSDPSTWKTRGSPPGALKPAVMTVPGRKPSSIKRWASPAGKSMRSKMPASPRRRSTSVANGTLACGLLPLSCIFDSVCPRPKILSRCGLYFFRFLRATGYPPSPSALNKKDNRMPARFLVRRLRASDLDRILEIEHASFGKDAYDPATSVCRIPPQMRRPVPGSAAGRENLRIYGHLRHRTRHSEAGGIDFRSRGSRGARQGGKGHRHDGQHAAAAALAGGVGRLVLMVRVTNSEARAFYEKYGFRKIRTVRRYYEDDGDGWLMARNEIRLRL